MADNMGIEVENDVIRPLPEGKQYHVFFSYKEGDGEQEFIRTLTSILRNNYGFLCCNHELDFIPGKKIVENIKDCISKSVKTVVVLSKEYTESSMCQIELETIIHEQRIRKESLLIPISREDLKDIPDYLPLVTYIDAKGPIEEWIHRLVSKIESPVENVKDTCFTQTFLQHTNYRTLDTIYETPTKSQCTGVPFETRFVPDWLQRSCLNLNPEIFSNVFQKASVNRLVRQRFYMNPWWPVCVCWSLTVPWMPFVGFAWIVIYITDVKWDFYVIMGPFLISLFVLFAIVWPCCCYHSNKKGKMELRHSFKDLNRTLMQHNIFVSYKKDTMTAKVTILFIYYNIQPCLICIQRQLKAKEPCLQEIERSPHSSDDSPSLTSDERQVDQQVNASELILNLSSDYFEDFLNGRIGYHIAHVDSERRMHSTRAMCFCEYAELKKVLPSSNRSEHVIVV